MTLYVAKRNIDGCAWVMAMIWGFFRSFKKRIVPQTQTHDNGRKTMAAAAAVATETANCACDGPAPPEHYRLEAVPEDFTTAMFLKRFPSAHSTVQFEKDRYCADSAKKKIGPIVEVGFVKGKQGQKVTLQQKNRKHYGDIDNCRVLPQKGDFWKDDNGVWFKTLSVVLSNTAPYRDTIISLNKCMKKKAKPVDAKKRDTAKKAKPKITKPVDAKPVDAKKPVDDDSGDKKASNADASRSETPPPVDSNVASATSVTQPGTTHTPMATHYFQTRISLRSILTLYVIF